MPETAYVDRCLQASEPLIGALQMGWLRQILFAGIFSSPRVAPFFLFFIFFLHRVAPFSPLLLTARAQTQSYQASLRDNLSRASLQTLRFPAEVTMVYLALSCLNRDRRPMAGTECWQLITPRVGKPRVGKK